MTGQAKQAATEAAPEPFGKYYLLDQMAVGGMAEIYRGTQLRSGGFQRLVVIKRIRAHLSSNKEFVDMFNDEARITVTLQHPNIVQVFDFDQSGDHLFLAMEYVRGKDLRQLMRALAKRRQFLPVEFAAYITLEICKGLGHAHEQVDIDGRALSIVHRDISPSNILLSYDGEVKVVDFGIARCEDKVSETRAGVLKGKFDYMSPEQIRGQQADARSDVFAVGILLHEMLSGRRLFKADSDLETLENIRSMPVPGLMELNASVPQQLNDIVLNALHRDPDVRYGSARKMADDLREWMAPASSDMMRDAMKAFMHELFKDEIDEEKQLLESRTRKARELWQIAAASAGAQSTASITPASTPAAASVSSAPGSNSNAAGPPSSPTLNPPSVSSPGTGSAASALGTAPYKVTPLPRAQSASRHVSFEDVPVVGYNPWIARGKIAGGVLVVALLGFGVWKALPRAPQVGAVRFDITPPNVDVEIYVDNQLKSTGHGSILVQLPVEVLHEADVRAPGYKTIHVPQLHVSVENTLGNPVYNPVQIEKEGGASVGPAPGGTVQFTSEPPGADVYIGNQLLCSPTPCSWDTGKAQQQSTVFFRKAGYKDTNYLVTVPPSGQTRPVGPVQLEAISNDPVNVLIVLDNGGLTGTVKVDGKVVGTGKEVKTKLAPGRHHIEALGQGNIFDERDIDIDPGADQTVKLQMYLDLNRPTK